MKIVSRCKKDLEKIKHPHKQTNTRTDRHKSADHSPTLEHLSPQSGPSPAPTAPLPRRAASIIGFPEKVNGYRGRQIAHLSRLLFRHLSPAPGRGEDGRYTAMECGTPGDEAGALETPTQAGRPADASNFKGNKEEQEGRTMKGASGSSTRPGTRDRKAKKLDKKIRKDLKAPFDEDKFGEVFEITFPLTEEQLPKIVKSLRNQMKLEKTCHKELLRQSLLHFLRINNIQKICLKKHEKIYIVGDLHGQFYDMLEIFVQSGFPSPTNKYVFNGDLVDRGYWSCEIFILLMCTMLARPWSVYINRGNHECSMMSAMYGFQKELEHKYSSSFIDEYIKMFYSLPLGTLLSLPRHQVKVENIIDYLGDRRMSFVYDKDNNPIKASKVHHQISKSCMISKKKEREEFLGLKNSDKSFSSERENYDDEKVKKIKVDEKLEQAEKETKNNDKSDGQLTTEKNQRENDKIIEGKSSRSKKKWR